MEALPKGAAETASIAWSPRVGEVGWLGRKGAKCLATQMGLRFIISTLALSRPILERHTQHRDRLHHEDWKRSEHRPENEAKNPPTWQTFCVDSSDKHHHHK